MAKRPKPNNQRAVRSPSARSHAELARTGDLKALFAIADLEAATSNDRKAYKWLNAASDFGHRRASSYISDVLEVTSLRYDDSGAEQAAAHWELATSYLEGTDGLPRDLRLAKKHLKRTFERFSSLEEINQCVSDKYDATPLLDRLHEDSRVVLAHALGGGYEHERALRYLKQIPRLIELSAPTVIVDDTRRRLREQIDRICPVPDAEAIQNMGSQPLAHELAFLEQLFEKVSTALTLARAESEQRQREREREQRAREQGQQNDS